MDSRPAPTPRLPLAIAGVLLLAGAGAAWLGWGLVVLRDRSAESLAVRPIPMANRSVEVSAAISEEHWALVAGLRLQGSNPPPEAPPSLAVHQTRGLVLLGTLVASDGTSEGLFRGTDGRLRVAAAGDRVGQARVEEITDGQARLNVMGRVVTLLTQRKQEEQRQEQKRGLIGGGS